MLGALEKIRHLRRPDLFRFAGRTIVLGIALFLTTLLAVQAQDVTPDVLRALQGVPGQGQNNRPLAPSNQTFQPAIPKPDTSLPSRLEDIYTQRAGRKLTQFGYDFLGSPASVSITQTGSIADSYLLGPGDELVFTLRGQENANYRLRIDRDGLVTLPKLRPIVAAGRSFGDFKKELRAQVGQAYLSTDVFVTLGGVHQFSVIVAGEVAAPGTRIINSLATPLDAILLSGGINKTGSLRNVQLIRAGVRHTIDLYSIIGQNDVTQLGSLRDGDRIYVPPLGATVAIDGFVRRPGIYELAGGARGIGAKMLIRLAGGIIISGTYNLSKTSLNRDGTNQLIPIAEGTSIQSGEVLFVDSNSNAALDRVAVSGAVSIEGTHPLSVARTTSDILRSSGDLRLEAYGPFAVIMRYDSATNALSLVPFSVTGALTRRSPVPLQSRDKIYVFSRTEARALAAIATKQLGGSPSDAPDPQIPQSPQPTQLPQPTGNQGSTAPSPPPPLSAFASPPGTTTGGVANSGDGEDRSDQRTLPPPGTSVEADALAASAALRRQATGGLFDPIAAPAETDNQIVDRVAGRLTITREQLLRFVSDNLVWVLDQVFLPGPYLAAKGTTIDEIVQAAGGSTQRSDMSSVEVTSTEFDRTTGLSRTTRASYAARDVSLASIQANPSDVIRLRAVYSDREEGTITIAGQVRYPGTFDIMRNERLSSVLQRAGGLTDVAYAYGAVFTRKDASTAERQANAREAKEVELQAVSLVSSPTNQGEVSQASVSFLVSLAQRLRDAPALGRVVVTADPVVLAIKPEFDLIVQPGDTLFIPKRPSSVTIAGEVLSPGSLQYAANLTVDDYIRLAGGVTATAEAERTFVVLPDGSSRPLSESWISFGNDQRVPPGSTIVVPRDLHPFSWSQFLKDATLITSQLAVTAASLAVLGRNN
ncbi:MAG: SLBB domain-containing protein [Rhizomicrobium sp.]